MPSVVHVIGATSRQTGSFERHLLAVIDEAAARDLSSRLVYPDPLPAGAFADALAERNVRVDVRACRSHGDVGFARWLRALLGSERRGIVHGHFQPTADLAAPVARVSGWPVVATRHYLAANAPRSGHGLMTRALGHLDAVSLAVSEPVAESLRGYGVPAARVRVAHLGVDTDHFAPASKEQRIAARRAYGFDPETAIAVATSHHRPGKGLEDLIDASAQLARRVTVVIAGDGPLRAQLEAQAGDSGGDVVFTGPVDDVRTLLAAADVFCLPTAGYPEGLPMAVLEAMASGVPVMATPVPALRGLVTEATGRMVPEGDPGALARAISDLATAPDRAGLARSARAVAETFSLPRCARAVVDVYEEVLAR